MIEQIYKSMVVRYHVPFEIINAVECLHVGGYDDAAFYLVRVLFALETAEAARAVTQAIYHSETTAIENDTIATLEVGDQYILTIEHGGETR